MAINARQNASADAHPALRLSQEGLLAEVLGFETHEVAGTAQGTDVATVGGTQFTDFTGGIAVHACGHGHPEIVQAIAQQAQCLLHTSDVLLHTPQLELAAFLRRILQQAAPSSPADWQFLFMNGGSESIDAAAKLALKASDRGRFVAFDGAFHGRTLFATALSRSKTLHWKAYEPIVGALRQQIAHAPSPADPNCAAGLEALLERGDVAAVFFEAEQGEGGYRPMAPELARQLRDLTRRHGALLIADEIQSGCGRTGRWFGFEHLGIEPDIVVFGKAVGGGLPLAGVAASAALMERWSPGEHGTTFGGNPLACAAGLAALRIIERDGLLMHAAALGERIKARLAPLVGRYGIADVRGNGLMLAIELRAADGSPDYARCDAMKLAVREQGLLVLTCGAKTGGPYDCAAIRLIPPLNTSDERADRALDLLIEALAAKG